MASIVQGTAASEVLDLAPDDEELLVYSNGGDDIFNVTGTLAEPVRVDVIAGDGNDALNGTFASGSFFGGAGNDTLDVRNSSYVFDGGAGSDTVNLGAPLSSFVVTSAGS